MAQSNRGKSPSSSKRNSPSNANTKSAGNKSVRNDQNSAKIPRRREIMAAVCFILAAFTFIAYFNADGAFIGLFTGLVRGLVGHGFFYLAPALLLCAVVLTFHRGRPVAFRVCCTLLLCVLAGALAHLFTRGTGHEFEISFTKIPVLWASGLEMQSGGVISGGIAELFGWLFGSIGSTVLLIIATIALLLVAINRSIVGIIDAIKNRPRTQYEYEPEVETAAAPMSDVRQRQVLKREPLSSKRKRAIDIPIDEVGGEQSQDLFDKNKREALFKSGSKVKAPDQVVAEYMPMKDAAEESKNLSGEQTKQMEDIPLDIPFMESKRRRNRKSSINIDLDPEPQEADNHMPVENNITAVADEPTAARKDEDKKSVVSNKRSEAKASELFEPVELDPDATYKFPPLDLLAQGTKSKNTGGDEVRQNSQRLETAFQSFGVNVTISNATRGPAVTRYEAALEAGVKLSKLTNLADDIALSLGTSGVRIAAMPNMISTVGIEVPNKSISTVYLRDIIESREFTSAKSKLTFAIGTNISGESIVGNVGKMPHMLVAGTTGSGKSVCLNSIILSILYKASPEDVRFIMIDPKMVEFKIYNDIPHLLVPVVTDVKKASGALQWAVFEMTKRYKLFSETNARDLAGYNEIAKESEDREVLPQIVIIIDELADLMMTAAKEVEESVCRVAQMGRASGMHLIIATQSPRADVITGLMKANIPSRISFKVSSALESRIILDAGGNADKLVGNGDMLFAPIGSDKPMRVQGTWVSDKEREKVVDFVKQSGETHYSEEVMGEIDKAAEDKSLGDKTPKEDAGASDHDELLPQAVDVIFETGQASVSMLQRRLKLGYSRAARIVDQMEQMGVVGPFEGSKPRAVLVTKDQWRQMQYVSGTAPEDKPTAMNAMPLIVPSNNEGIE